MKEAILHYIWQYKLFSQHDLRSTDGQTIEIIDVGKPNQHAGPDFFNAKIKIGQTVWAGNVEIHYRSSDWNRHQHQTDVNYNNVILHVVRKVDIPVFRMDGQKIPQIELSYTDGIEQHYESLIQSTKWIACENEIQRLPSIYINQWKHALLLERMVQKVQELDTLLLTNKNHWEETFFIILSKHLGLGINNEPFLRLTRSISWSLISKTADDLIQLEALLFGYSGLLEQTNYEDDYIVALKQAYAFLQRKYSLQTLENIHWRLLRLRPSNFPHIRMAQLAALLHQNRKLFDTMVNFQSLSHLIDLFQQVEVSEYWKNHYLFGVPSVHKNKPLGRFTINNLLINAVAPMIFCYGKHKECQELKDKALFLLQEIPAEQNYITKKWKELGFELLHAADTQSVIHLFKNYCEEKKCLRCRIGHKVLTITT